MHVRYQGVTLRSARATTLADLTLQVPSGTIACFYGPTRSGKSSLLLMTGGFLKPTAGQIHLGDTAAHLAPMQARRLTGLGIIPEFNPLLSSLSVQENLLFQARLFSVSHPDKRVQTLLAELNLLGAARRRPEELTQPEMLRSGIAMALVHNPPVVLIDEPSHAMTTRELVEQWPYMEDLKKQGKTVLVSSHSLWVARNADLCFSLPTGKEVHPDEFTAVGLA